MPHKTDPGRSKARRRDAAIPAGADTGKEAADQRPGADSAPGEGRSFGVESDDGVVGAHGEEPAEARRNVESGREGRNTDVERG